MTSIVSDPTTLTKDKLKRELSKYEVDLPSSDAKKDVYVELYRRVVLNQTSEFSSDDEPSPKPRRKKPGTPKKALPKKPTMEANGLDVSALSDRELAEKLKEYGVTTGPIMVTTRPLYVKKLERLLAASHQAEPAPILRQAEEDEAALRAADTLSLEPAEDEFSQDSEPEPPAPEPPVSRRRQPPRSPARPAAPAPVEEPIAPIIPPLAAPQAPAAAPAPAAPAPAAPAAAPSSSARSRRQAPGTPPKFRDGLARRPTRSMQMRTEKRSVDMTDSTVTTTSVTKTTELSADDLVTQVDPQVEQVAPRGGMSVWLQVGLFLLVAALVFFVVQSMEPAASDPVRKLPNAP